jgi:release factor glutamine methyltransferase
VADLLRQGAAELASSKSPRLDAELLLADCLGFERSRLLARCDLRVAEPAAAHFESLLAARRRGEPIAYLLGHREFWSLDISVSRDTLVPRPETELLVELALNTIETGAATAVDLGTGSGAVAIALAHERPAWRVLGVDDRPRSLSIARANGRRHRLGNLNFIAGDWATALAPDCADLIVANPPYVARDDPAFSDSAIQHEPRHALDGGADGMECISRLVAQAATALRPGGWLFFEHGAAQGVQGRRLLAAAGFAEPATHHDLAGHPRVSGGRR